MGGEGISGSGFGDYTNQNKIPLAPSSSPIVTGLVASTLSK